MRWMKGKERGPRRRRREEGMIHQKWNGPGKEECSSGKRERAEVDLTEGQRGKSYKRKVGNKMG